MIEDRIPSLTPDNDILHQFKASSAAGGMIISIIIPRELIMIITPLGMKLWILSSLPASTAVSQSRSEVEMSQSRTTVSFYGIAQFCSIFI